MKLILILIGVYMIIGAIVTLTIVKFKDDELITGEFIGFCSWVLVIVSTMSTVYLFD